MAYHLVQINYKAQILPEMKISYIIALSWCSPIFSRILRIFPECNSQVLRSRLVLWPYSICLASFFSSSQSTSSPLDDPNFLQLSLTHMVLRSASETLFMIFLSPKTSFLPFLLSKFHHGHEFEQTLGGQ